jgi:RNA polymerase sigma factor (sigma-70 family)
MADAPTTNASLLIRVRNPRDEQAWTQFEEVYRPLVYGFVRKHGLQDADAADLSQEVLRLVSSAIKKLEYDPQVGSFRGWLFTVVRNQLRKFLGRRRPHEQGTGDTEMQDILAEQPSPEESETQEWVEEYERRMFTFAAAQVRGDFKESTWQAFWQTGVQGMRAKEVAKSLGMTVAAVYLAKSRVMARLKEQIRHLQGG